MSFAWSTQKNLSGGDLIIQGVLKILALNWYAPPTLFFPCHNNKKNKSLHQNLPEGSKLQVCNFAYGLNLMEDNF